ncbi:MAG: hypothetical protein RLO50_22810, partial [Azospirillaceae bacterium]
MKKFHRRFARSEAEMRNLAPVFAEVPAWLREVSALPAVGRNDEEMMRKLSVVPHAAKRRCGTSRDR